MTQIIWSPQALRDFEAIRTSIAEDSPRVAELVVGRIIKAVEPLKAFPESGRKVPERNDCLDCRGKPRTLQNYRRVHPDRSWSEQ